MSWSTVPLSELMPSKIPSVDPAKHPNETFELWSIPAFDAGTPEVIAGSEIGSSKKCVEPNDVLLSRIVPHIRRAWVVGDQNGHRQIASGEWITFRSDRVHPPYLRQLLISDFFHVQFMQTVAGVGGSLLRARPEGVKQIEIPLPPMEEQRRIAAILDAADALRAKRRAALAKLDTLAQSIFIEMFGDPATNPMGWQRTLMSEICEIPSSLVDPREKSFRDLLHYGPDRIEKDTGRLLPARSAAEDGVESGKFLFEGGMLLYSKIRPYLNKVARVDFRGLCSADVYPLKIVSQSFTREFLWVLLRQDEFLKFAASFSGRANIPKINRNQLMSYAVMSPPSALQRNLSTEIEEIERLRSKCSHALNEASNLFASLQHRAFRGELTASDLEEAVA